MKRTGLVLLLVPTALVNLACATNVPTAQNSQPANIASPVDPFAAAKKHYQAQCIACHGDKGQGGAVKIEDVSLNVPSLTEGHALTHTDEEMVKQIMNGGEGMPAFKNKLSTQEAGELVRYIRREFQGR